MLGRVCVVSPQGRVGCCVGRREIPRARESTEFASRPKVDVDFGSVDSRWKICLSDGTDWQSGRGCDRQQNRPGRLKTLPGCKKNLGRERQRVCPGPAGASCAIPLVRFRKVSSHVHLISLLKYAAASKKDMQSRVLIIG